MVGGYSTLSAFIATQAGWLTATSAPYLGLNVIGPGAPVTSPVVDSQWGFVILEGVWAAVSAVARCRRLLCRLS